MGMYSANSDRDYSDIAHGPYPERVERTCSRCGEVFRLLVEGEYVAHPLCDACWRDAQAIQERQSPARPKDSAA